MFKQLIWVKENSLTEEFCKSVIDKFETDPYRQPGKVDQNNPRIDKDLKVTIDTGVTSNIAWKEEDKILPHLGCIFVPSINSVQPPSFSSTVFKYQM